MPKFCICTLRSCKAILLISMKKGGIAVILFMTMYWNNIRPLKNKMKLYILYKICRPLIDIIDLHYCLKTIKNQSVSHTSALGDMFVPHKHVTLVFFQKFFTLLYLSTVKSDVLVWAVVSLWSLCVSFWFLCLFCIFYFCTFNWLLNK